MKIIFLLFPLIFFFLSSCGEHELLLSEGLGMLDCFYFGNSNMPYIFYNNQLYCYTDNNKYVPMDGFDGIRSFRKYGDLLFTRKLESVCCYDKNFELLNEYLICDEEDLTRYIEVIGDYIYVRHYFKYIVTKINYKTNEIKTVDFKHENNFDYVEDYVFYDSPRHFYSIIDGTEAKEVSHVYYENDMRFDEIRIYIKDGSYFWFRPSTHLVGYWSIIKHFNGRSFFPLFSPVYNEGCRISHPRVMDYYTSDYPCEHSIGMTYLYSFDGNDNKVELIKEVGEGAFVFDIDSNLNVRYYANDAIYENNKMIKTVDYNHSTKTVTRPFWYTPIKENDYCCYRLFGYLDGQYFYGIDNLNGQIEIKKI